MVYGQMSANWPWGDQGFVCSSPVCQTSYATSVLNKKMEDKIVIVPLLALMYDLGVHSESILMQQCS